MDKSVAKNDMNKEISKQAALHLLSPANAIMNRLRAAVDEAEEEVRQSMFSMTASCEQRAAQNLQALQEQVDNAQQTHFILQDRNQEVLMINSMLRSELAEVRKENEAFRQQLKVREQEFQIGGGSGPSLARLTDITVPASCIVLPAQKRAGIRKTRLKQRTTDRERSAKK
ncbi:hypothetical protein AG0111_0g12081 [Alternaria gaisen]|uniref:Uncharacterized protein n=1 Tax=Alternaria gaisen TaxID=167740 RepID=A0ACB6F5G7_9PLEO|nr:hypothetical protein AG0111_0g12081 [Alternaria gaisen]